MSFAQNFTNPSSRRLWLNRALLYLILVFTILTFPLQPAMDLDASWRMALGKFLLDGLQFGHDVVFTYGPLGFLMGKTYYGSGTLFKGMLVWQLFSSFTFAAIIMMWGERLSGWPKIIYYAFFILFGVTYDDAMEMLIIVMSGMELIRRSGQRRKWSSVGLLVLLSLMSVIKFTNLLLAVFVVLVTTGHDLWLKRNKQGLGTLAWYLGAFFAFWMLCWQNPLNLPAYLHNSWLVSQGYQEAMGIATPLAPFWKALVVCMLLGFYLSHNFLTQKNRARTLGYSLILCAFLFLNWKHGFVRSDGHMVGFFFCALLPVVLFPVLLEDAAQWRRLKRMLLIPAGVLCILGIYDTLPGMVDYGLGIFQTKVWTNVANTLHLGHLRESYDIRLAEQRKSYELDRTRTVIGSHSVDVIGYDQAPVLFSRLNYTPRPVFQSYSAYTPELAKLNADFYASDQAPDYVLLKIQSIDQRLAAMDDSAALYLISHRYTYVETEKGFQLWRKKNEAFDANKIAPRFLVDKSLPLGGTWLIEQYADKRLWATIDLQPTLLGRLRSFFYKPPFIQLVVQDMSGNSSTYRMPAPIGRSGFIISPIIEDIMGYIYFSGGKPERNTRSISIHVDPEDQKYFSANAKIQLFSLSTPTGGLDFFTLVNKQRFHMFNTVPVSFDAQAAPSEETIDGKPVMIMHAPSEMTFDLPRSATEITGKHGYLPGAYTNGGHTNGAIFVIEWSDGKNTLELYRRFLDPVKNTLDRGLIPFHVKLKGLDGGRLYFRVLPGPYNDHSWDWTGWADITIK